jgi:hypothetical protein
VEDNKANKAASEADKDNKAEWECSKVECNKEEWECKGASKAASTKAEISKETNKWSPPLCQ